MTPHDDLKIKGERFKEELWAYMDEFLKGNGFTLEISNAKMLMNSLLGTIDSFVDRPEYK